MTSRGRGRGTGVNLSVGHGRTGGGGFGARGRGGFGRDNGPPSEILEMGSFLHNCEGEMVCASSNFKIPYFNAPIFLQNKTSIGKVDEILGPISSLYFTIKPSEGIQASSFKTGDKFYISGDRLLPLEKFLPKPKSTPGVSKPKRPGTKGGRGAPTRGGRGSNRGIAHGRGGFSLRGGNDRGGRGGSNFSRGGSGFNQRARGPSRSSFSSRGGFSSRSRG